MEKRHIPFFEDGRWTCMICDFVTEDMHEAHEHYMTGMERIMDALGVPD